MRKLSLTLANLLPFLTLLVTATASLAAENPQQSYFHELDQPVAQSTTVITPQGSGANNTYIVMEKYQLRAGDKISEAVANWCKRSGWSLSWDAPELLSEADVDIDGQFEAVVELVLDALNRSGAKIGATFYDANRVLRITEKK